MTIIHVCKKKMYKIYFMYIIGYNSFVSMYNDTIANNNKNNFELEKVNIILD
jgi:hypothetical protein